MQKPIALITGSSTGIGAKLAEYLAKNNFIPIITYNSHASEAALLLKKIKKVCPESESYSLNLLDEESIKVLSQKVSVRFNHIDLLICNAGVDYYHETFEDIDLNEWQEVFGIKVFGNYLIVKHMLALLKNSNNPNIITISASLAQNPDPLDPAYSSASAALNNLSMSFAKHLAKNNIRTNVICPGPMDTSLQYWKTVKQSKPDIFSSFLRTNPLHKSTQPENIGDIIKTIYFNPVLTGNIINVSAGSHLL